MSLIKTRIFYVGLGLIALSFVLGYYLYSQYPVEPRYLSETYSDGSVLVIYTDNSSILYKDGYTQADKIAELELAGIERDKLKPLVFSTIIIFVSGIAILIPYFILRFSGGLKK